ncbi:6514_t:CDS:2, partial [Ambispora leptoticha]
AKDILKSINQDSSNSATQLSSPSTYRTRMTINCYCQKCNSKLVDPRTKNRHSQSQTGFNELRQPTRIASELSGLSQQSVTTIDSRSDNELPSGPDNELPSSLDMDDLSFLPRKQLAEEIRYSNINEFEDYSVPDIDYEKEFQSNPRVSSIFDDILIWLLKYQSQFKVSEEATEVLVKYIQRLLCEFGDENIFQNFLSSMHKLRKHLKIDNFITYSVCPNCDKLYTEEE